MAKKAPPRTTAATAKKAAKKTTRKGTKKVTKKTVTTTEHEGGTTTVAKPDETEPATTPRPKGKRLSLAEQIARRKEQIATLEKKAAEAEARALAKEAAGPSSRDLNMIGRQVRLLVKVLKLVDATAKGTDPNTNAACVAHLQGLCAVLVDRHIEGKATHEAWAKEHGEAVKVGDVKPLASGDVTDAQITDACATGQVKA